MTFSTETVDILNEGLEFHDRQGPRGVKFKYVKTEDVIQKLNRAFGHAWSSTVINSSMEGDFVVVLIELAAGVTRKQAFGGAQVMRSKADKSVIDLANAYKSAFANALKGAAKQFGVGLNESDDEDTSTQTRSYSKAPPISAQTNAHGTEVSASASTTLKVGKTSSKDEMLAKALAMMKSDKASTSEKTEAKPTPKAESPFPTSNTDEGSATDIQITAIQKLCARASKTEEELFEEARGAGVLKSSAKKAEELKKNEGAAMIRFLTHKKASNG